LFLLLQLWENFVVVSLNTENWSDAMQGIRELVRLKDNSKRPIDTQAMKFLVKVMTSELNLRQVHHQHRRRRRHHRHFDCLHHGHD
jgi:hypothetical protein